MKLQNITALGLLFILALGLSQDSVYGQNESQGACPEIAGQGSRPGASQAFYDGDCGEGKFGNEWDKYAITDTRFDDGAVGIPHPWDIWPSKTGCYNPEERFSVEVELDPSNPLYREPFWRIPDSNILMTNPKCLPGGESFRYLNEAAGNHMYYRDVDALLKEGRQEVGSPNGILDKDINRENRKKIATSELTAQNESYNLLCYLDDYADDFDDFCGDFLNERNTYRYRPKDEDANRDDPKPLEYIWRKEPLVPPIYTNDRYLQKAFPRLQCGEFGRNNYNSVQDKTYAFNRDNVYLETYNDGGTELPRDFYNHPDDVRERLDPKNWGYKEKRMECLKQYVSEWAHRGDCGEIVLEGARSDIGEGHCQWVKMYDEGAGTGFKHGIRSEHYDWANFVYRGYMEDHEDSNVCKKKLAETDMPSLYRYKDEYYDINPEPPGGGTAPKYCIPCSAALPCAEGSCVAGFCTDGSGYCKWPFQPFEPRSEPDSAAPPESVAADDKWIDFTKRMCGATISQPSSIYSQYLYCNPEVGGWRFAWDPFNQIIYDAEALRPITRVEAALDTATIDPDGTPGPLGDPPLKEVTRDYGAKRCVLGGLEWTGNPQGSGLQYSIALANIIDGAFGSNLRGLISGHTSARYNESKNQFGHMWCNFDSPTEITGKLASSGDAKEQINNSLSEFNLNRNMVERVRDVCHAFTGRGAYSWDRNSSLPGFFGYGLYKHNRVDGKDASRCVFWNGAFKRRYFVNDLEILNWRLPRFDYEFLRRFADCVGPKVSPPKACSGIRNWICTHECKCRARKPDGTCKFGPCTPEYANAKGGADQYYTPGSPWFSEGTWHEAVPTGCPGPCCDTRPDYDSVRPIPIPKTSKTFWCDCEKNFHLTYYCNENYCTCNQQGTGTVDRYSPGANPWDPPIEAPDGINDPDYVPHCDESNPYLEILPELFNVAFNEENPGESGRYDGKIPAPYGRWLNCFYHARNHACPVLERPVSRGISPATAIHDRDNAIGEAPEWEFTPLRWTFEEPNILAVVTLWDDFSSAENGPRGFRKHWEFVSHTQTKSYQTPYFEPTISYPINDNEGSAGEDKYVKSHDSVNEQYDRQNFVGQTITGARGCDIGGWYELLMYQARCIRVFKLNCLCDYEKTFAEGNAEAYVLIRGGARFDTYRKNPDTNKVEKVPLIWPLMWRGYASPTYAKECGRDNARLWKFYRDFEYKGLDCARPGDFIIYDEQLRTEPDPSDPDPIVQTIGKDARARRHIAYVETVSFETRKKADGKQDERCDIIDPSDDDYIIVSEWNFGKNQDSCGVTNRWKKRTVRKIFKNQQNITRVTGEGISDKFGKYGPCKDPDNAVCYEENWERVKVYRASEDNYIELEEVPNQPYVAPSTPIGVDCAAGTYNQCTLEGGGPGCSTSLPIPDDRRDEWCANCAKARPICPPPEKITEGWLSGEGYDRDDPEEGWRYQYIGAYDYEETAKALRERIGVCEPPVSLRQGLALSSYLQTDLTRSGAKGLRVFTPTKEDPSAGEYGGPEEDRATPASDSGKWKGTDGREAPACWIINPDYPDGPDGEAGTGDDDPVRYKILEDNGLCETCWMVIGNDQVACRSPLSKEVDGPYGRQECGYYCSEAGGGDISPLEPETP